MTKFLKPKFTLNQETSTSTYMEFSVDNLERGFGHTIGNTLRRALIETVPGVAIYAVRVKGVNHEFSTINGVLENVIDIVLNIKNIILKYDFDYDFDEEIEPLTITVSDARIITAADIVCPAGIEVVNQEQVIATTTDRNVLLEVELFVKQSRSYASFEQNKKIIGNSLGLIAIDADYCPVNNVSYHVEPVTKTIKGVDYEKLTFKLATNGALDPHTAIAYAAKVLNSYFELFISLKEQMSMFDVIDFDDNKENDELLNTPIEDLALNARSYHSLKNEGIKTLGEIAQKTIEELSAIKNLGKKSIEEIEACVNAKGLFLARKI